MTLPLSVIPPFALVLPPPLKAPPLHVNSPLIATLPAPPSVPALIVSVDSVEVVARSSVPPVMAKFSALVRLLTATVPVRNVTVTFAAGRSMTTSSPGWGTMPVLQFEGTSQKPSLSTFHETVTASTVTGPANMQATRTTGHSRRRPKCASVDLRAHQRCEAMTYGMRKPLQMDEWRRALVDGAAAAYTPRRPSVNVVSRRLKTRPSPPSSVSTTGRRAAELRQDSPARRRWFRRVLTLVPALAQDELLDLAGAGERELVDEDPVARRLRRGETLADMGAQLLRRSGARRQRSERTRRAPRPSSGRARRPPRPRPPPDARAEPPRSPPGRGSRRHE